MTIRKCAACALLLALSCGFPGLARAGGAADLHAAWRGCLQRSFATQASLTSRADAVDASLRACKARETAYLAALSTSPLLDEEDVAHARPVLIQKAKGWLLAGATQPL